MRQRQNQIMLDYFPAKSDSKTCASDAPFTPPDNIIPLDGRKQITTLACTAQGPPEKTQQTPQQDAQKLQMRPAMLFAKKTAKEEIMKHKAGETGLFFVVVAATLSSRLPSERMKAPRAALLIRDQQIRRTT